MEWKDNRNIKRKEGVKVMSDMQPLKYAIYKGFGGKMGAAQFVYRQPHFFCSKNKEHKFFDGDVVKNASSRRNTPCPVEGCDGKLSSRDGCILLDIASATGKNKYDWDNKIIIQLSVKDIGQLLVGLINGKQVMITHDPGAGTEKKGNIVKTLSLSFPKGISEGGFLCCTETRDGEKTEHRVGITADEIISLTELLKSAIPRCLAWEN